MAKIHIGDTSVQDNVLTNLVGLTVSLNLMDIRSRACYRGNVKAIESSGHPRGDGSAVPCDVNWGIERHSPKHNQDTDVTGAPGILYQNHPSYSPQINSISINLSIGVLAITTETVGKQCQSNAVLSFKFRWREYDSPSRR